MPWFLLPPEGVWVNKLIKDGAYLLELAVDIISNLISYDKLKKSLEELESYSNNFKIPIGAARHRCYQRGKKTSYRIIICFSCNI